MNARLFWKALVVQAVVVAIPFAILGVALSEDFFEDWGWLVGPVVWLACSLVTARILEIPLAYVLFSAVAGGVAGLIVMLVADPLGRHDRRAAGLRRFVRQLRPAARGRGGRGGRLSRGDGIRTREFPA